MSEPPFPSAIRVGHNAYRVQPLDIAESDDTAAFGRHSSRHLRIYIHRAEPARTAEWLVHEILHAIQHFVAWCEAGGPSEEYAVTVHANGLTQVMRDNPDLRAWLAWAWAQED